MTTMAIDYVRQILEQTLEQEHDKYPNKYFGGENQVKLFSFYEQLQEEYEVNRYRELYRDLVDQQNRTSLVMNGTIVAPENPQIMNTHNHLIIPMSFSTMFRVMLKDRDSAIDTIDHLFKVLKGRKQDIAELDTGKLFAVGTIANDINGTPSIKSGDYIGELGTDTPSPLTLENKINSLTSIGLVDEIGNDGYVYFKGNTGKLRVAKRVRHELDVDGIVLESTEVFQAENEMEIDGVVSFESVETDFTTIPQWLDYLVGKVIVYLDDGNVSDSITTELYVDSGSLVLLDGRIFGSCAFSIYKPLDAYDYANLQISIDTQLVEMPQSNLLEQIFSEENYPDVLFPPQHESFEKYQLSLSFDSIRIDQPNTLNANEYITISFGGSATLVDSKVALGNQLTKVGIKKYKVQAQTDIDITDTYHYLEPLEMPSGLGISGEISQLASHNFIQNTHNDGIKPTFNYSFVLDFNDPLIYQFFKYARYGITGTLANTFNDGVSPNMLFKIQETWSAWGSIEIFEFIAKATDNIDIDNTESDSLTIKLSFDLQKE